MANNFTLTIADTQIINGVEYTEAQLLQGLAQVRTQHNQRTGESLSDSEWLQWSYLQNLAAWYEQNKGSEPVEPSPIEPQADWEALLLHLASGDLYTLFERNREVAESSTSVALYRGDIVSAITTIKREEFLAAGLGLLQQRAGYEFTQQEIADWNRVTEQLGFSAMVRI